MSTPPVPETSNTNSSDPNNTRRREGLGFEAGAKRLRAPEVAGYHGSELFGSVVLSTAAVTRKTPAATRPSHRDPPPLVLELQSATHAVGIHVESALGGTGLSQGEAHVLALLA